MSEAKRLLQELQADPQLREELAAALRESGDTEPRDWWRDRARPFLAGLSSAAVVMTLHPRVRTNLFSRKLRKS